jgi:heptosyltransferase-3
MSTPGKPIALRPDARILVVALRRLGDVLLTTPLIRSVKCAFPAASIEALVFAGTEGILSGNPDLAGVLTIPERASLGQSFALMRRMARRYDLALSTQTGDRPTALAVIAGRQSAGPRDAGRASALLKRLALSRSCTADRTQHRIVDLLRLADLIGIAPAREVVVPQGDVRDDVRPGQPYAVVHAAPKFNYKRWTAEGWRELAAALRVRGLRSVVIGAKADRAYLDAVWRGAEVVRRDGELSWPEISALIGGAQIYVGPDTAVTHLAAATGTPTVALYGPTDPRIWGPWPRQGLDRPWDASGTIQHRNNVWLVQNPLPCLPCQLEGCERRLDSRSQCLDELTAAQVVTAVDQALAIRRAA